MRFIIALFLLTPFVALGQDAPQAAPKSEAASAAQPFAMPEITPDILKDLEEYWLPIKAPEGATGVTSLDVRQSVTMALQNNMAGKIAEQDVVAARERIGQARSQLFPQAKIDETYTHVELEGANITTSLGMFGGQSLLAPFQLIGGLLEPGGVDFVDAGTGLLSLLTKTPSFSIYPDMLRDHANITQTLYAGGQIRAAIRASKYLAQSQEWKKQARLDQLEYDTKKAYYDTLLTQALVRVAEESVTTFGRHLADTQQMLDVGLVSNFELLRAKTEVGSRQADLVAARNGKKLALTNLRRIIGLPQDAPVQLEGKLGLSLEVEPIDKLLPIALSSRPELKTLEKGILAQEQNVRRTKGEYLPKAAASIDYTRVEGGGALAMLSQQGWTFAVVGQWDVYAGGKRKHDVAEQKATLSGLEYQKTDVTQLVELDVRQSYIQIQDALAKIREQKGTVDLAREGKRLADLRYQEGVGTQVETLDADLALTRAESALVQALHDYAVAEAALDKAISRSWAPRDTGEK